MNKTKKAIVNPEYICCEKNREGIIKIEKTMNFILANRGKTNTKERKDK